MVDKRLQEYLKKYDGLWENNTPLIVIRKRKREKIK